MTTNTTLPTETKQIMLLAAAEESFCQAAIILYKELKSLAGGDDTMNRDTVIAGFHLLEEAMNNHNIYRESMK